MPVEDGAFRLMGMQLAMGPMSRSANSGRRWLRSCADTDDLVDAADGGAYRAHAKGPGLVIEVGPPCVLLMRELHHNGIESQAKRIDAVRCAARFAKTTEIPG